MGGRLHHMPEAKEYKAEYHSGCQLSHNISLFCNDLRSCRNLYFCFLLGQGDSCALGER